ncbi:MobF family relaxase [Pedobacter sp. KACC 23697]|uniref:MobF family relaxase n=1 Tax=Pedobacter sp. KACC 23697 TaxID=3149230 RepID=A0AAU7K7Q5_9SPHI
MIRMIQCQSTDHAKKYFSSALEQSDYYVSDQELQGQFHGKMAARLNILGNTTREVFFNLCENRNPNTMKPLTRITRGDRTIFYDINFHAPKSVSILNMLNKDGHIQDAFKSSVLEVMKSIESDMQTRIRVGNTHADRRTAEILFAEFTHLTARPVDGATPDCHLHSHCTVFNCTFDSIEQKVKAGQFRDIKRDMPMYQSIFHKVLSDKLIDLGYTIKKTPKSFEIVGVPQDAIDLMSKRTNEIGQFAKEHNITDRSKLSELGARTRSAKQKGMSLEQLTSDWKRQLSELPSYHETSTGVAVRYKTKHKKIELNAKDCVNYSFVHSFERASVVPERRLLATCYSHSIGHRNISIDEIDKEFAAEPQIIKVEDRNRISCTTLEVLKEEQHMVNLALKGIGQLSPLFDQLPNIKATDEHFRAIEHILTTKNRVSIVKGGAGTGKTTLMSEAVDLIESTGQKVTVVAPSSQASRKVLRDEGFSKADTVSKLLLDSEMQSQLKNNTLWVDEAGLLSNHQMTKLLEISTQQNARLILGGDTMQHSAVLRGDSLRVLNVVGGIRAAEVNKVYRQKDELYRKAVEDLAKGNVNEGFEKLDSLGAIKEIDPMKPNEQLVQDYVATRKSGKTALIISPTHAQGESVTKDVREKLKNSRVIGKRETSITKLHNMNMTEAQKSDYRNYKDGNVVRFNQNVAKMKRGSVWEIESISDSNIVVHDKKGQRHLLPIDKAKDFDVYQSLTLAVSKGDELKITHNCFDKNGKRLDNGQSLRLNEVTRSGEIILINPNSKSTFVLDKSFGHIDHNYYNTSNASQGKTVDEIFICQPSGTFSATDSKQFYVSVSRGRDAAHIYTDDKFALLEHASVLKDRQAALELLADRNISVDIVHSLQRQKEHPQPEIKKKHRIKEDYEPGI